MKKREKTNGNETKKNSLVDNAAKTK